MLGQDGKHNVNIHTDRFNRPYRALWDTEASHALVELCVVNELGLIPESIVSVRGIDGVDSELEAYQSLRHAFWI